jgi:hypothetical protein
MHCCDQLDEAIERGSLYCGQKSRIDDGRILNDLDTDYFVRSASAHRFDYLGINYCPFCGRVTRRSLWIAEGEK